MREQSRAEQSSSSSPSTKKVYKERKREQEQQLRSFSSLLFFSTDETEKSFRSGSFAQPGLGWQAGWVAARLAGLFLPCQPYFVVFPLTGSFLSWDFEEARNCR